MVEATKLPVKTEQKNVAGPAMVPWAPFDSLRQEIDRLFENFGSGLLRSPFSRRGFDLDLPWPRSTSWSIAPAVDIAEKDNEYELTAELPGLSDKDIEVKLSNGSLTIKGEKKEEKEEHEKDYHLSERRYGSFTRSFRLPEGADADKIDASFVNGVLKVKVPKTAEAKKNDKKIAIKVA